MTADREALVAAIAAEPADDTPRLVFADWLEEHGEGDRAEFIRLECELAAHCRELDFPYPLPGPLEELQQRSRDLFDLRGKFWIEPFLRELGAEETPPRAQPRTWSGRLWQRVAGEPRFECHCVEEFGGGYAGFKNWGNGPVLGLGLQRGFVHHVNVSLRSRFPVGDVTAAFRLEPVTNLSVLVGPNAAHWRRLDAAGLRRVTQLNLELPRDDERRDAATLKALLHGENWPALRELHFWGRTEWGRGVPGRYVESLAESPLLAGLHTLWAAISAADLPRLTINPLASRLRSLNLWGCYLPPEAGDVIGGATFRPNLESLDLSLNHLGDDGVRRLVAAGPWPRLRSLDLGFNDLADAGVRHLLPLAPQLTDLCLAGKEITNAGAMSLAECLNPAKLASLWLSYNPLSPETVATLRGRFGSRFHFRTRDEDRALPY